MQELSRRYEIIFVDDGSTDSSIDILHQIYQADADHVRIVEFRRNFGKTAALVAGFDMADNDIVITMDADLQDDPAEIPAMIQKPYAKNCELGFVSGWVSVMKLMRKPSPYRQLLSPSMKCRSLTTAFRLKDS